MNTTFPNTPDFTGLLRPSRAEFDAFDLEIEGTLPREIDGTFFRVQPDPLYPPEIEHDIFFNGDGCVTAIDLHGGRARMRQRFVQTERYTLTREAQRAVFGRYRNPFTYDPSVQGHDGTTSNTNVQPFNGRLLALKEDALPYALDLETLDTLGRHTFDGQVTATAFTAHPKIDCLTGELHGCGYEARGLATKDVVYYRFDRNGRKLTEAWFEAPFAGMIHDMAFSQHFVVLPLIPQASDLERLKAGGAHFQWQPEEPTYFAVLPRNGDVSKLRWMKGPKNCFQGHVFNAFDDGRHVHIDLSFADRNVFPFFPDAQGHVPPMHDLKCPVTRFTFDMQSDSDDAVLTPLSESNVEFGRIDDRFAGQPYRWGYAMSVDFTRPYDLPGVGLPPHPFFFNVLVKMNFVTGEEAHWWPGADASLQEPVFVPRSAHAPEGDGYVMALVNRLADDRTELVVLDTQRWDEGPVCTVRMPLRLRMGVHGNWLARQGRVDR